MSAEDFEVAIETALGEYACSNDTPCGGTGYVDEEEELPYRVLFCDGVSESYATAGEAIQAAEVYAEKMDKESV